jgi:hypothetical protein
MKKRNVNWQQFSVGVCRHGLRPLRPTTVTIPDSLWAVMEAGWNVDPHQRPTLEDMDDLFYQLDPERDAS